MGKTILFSVEDTKKRLEMLAQSFSTEEEVEVVETEEVKEEVVETETEVEVKDEEVIDETEVKETETDSKEKEEETDEEKAEFNEVVETEAVESEVEKTEVDMSKFSTELFSILDNMSEKINSQDETIKELNTKLEGFKSMSGDPVYSEIKPEEKPNYYSEDFNKSIEGL